MDFSNQHYYHFAIFNLLKKLNLIIIMSQAPVPKKFRTHT